MTEPVFVGLDGEMTNNTPPPDGQLVQIGIALGPPTNARFVSDIRPIFFRFSEEARKVNGFTDERVRAAQQPAAVDNHLYEWLVEHGAKPKSLVPVGFNVGNFDMIYVRYYLPRTASLFSYRSVDLNAIVFTLAQVLGKNWKDIKTDAKKFAANPKPHDALADAVEALDCWNYLQRLIYRGGRDSWSL